MMNLQALDMTGFGQMEMGPTSSSYYNPGAPRGMQQAPQGPMMPQMPQQQPGALPPALAAYFAQVNRPNNVSPFGGSQFGLPYDPNSQPGQMPSFGAFGPIPYQPQPMQPQMQQPGGFPPNPGGFAALRNLGFGGR